ncbi:MAG: IS200/IS605 family transposase [Alphaproteobacteria bacterium]|jgi:putative transposase|nr:IS200/IS605 family transposase [Alphaproteobacteria bacterium]
MKVRAGRQIRFSLSVHLVFVTKAAGEVFCREALNDLHGMCADICRSFEAELLFFAGGSDWVRLTVTYAPAVELPVLVNSLKTVSSRLIRKAGYAGITAALDAAKGALWSPSYLAVSGDRQDVETLVLEFIEEQGGGAML